MTDHPDTEALSAFLDGEAPEVDTHVATCAECRRQLDALGRVRSAVGAPVPPPAPRTRDAAVAAALDAVDRPTPDRRRQWTVVVAAGAVAAALLLGLVVTRAGTSSKSSKTAAVSSNLVRAGDLGNVDDAQGLRAKIEPRLTQTAAQAPDKGAASAAGQSGGGGGGAAATPERRAASEARQAPAEAPRCEGAARALQPGRALLVYVATVRWKGTPADVFGFSPAGAPVTGSPGRPTPTRVYVLARSDCHLLVFQSYAP
jgi:hypothetical protein